MAWHLGYPLSQTLFTNVYVDGILMPQPSSLEQADFIRDPKAREERPSMQLVLRAYCLGLLKSCSYVIKHITCELYFEVGIPSFCPSKADALTVSTRRRTS